MWEIESVKLGAFFKQQIMIDSGRVARSLIRVKPPAFPLPLFDCCCNIFMVSNLDTLILFHNIVPLQEPERRKLIKFSKKPENEKIVGYFCSLSQSATDFRMVSAEMSTTGTIIFSFVSIVGSYFGMSA